MRWPSIVTGKSGQNQTPFSPIIPFRPLSSLTTAQLKTFLKVQLTWNVVLPAANLNVKGLMLQKTFAIRLMDDFSNKKATKDLGYFVALTNLDKIGEGKVVVYSRDVLYPVSFTCITLKIFRGPIKNLNLFNQKMKGFKYVAAENPLFMNDKTGSRIEKGTTL